MVDPAFMFLDIEGEYVSIIRQQVRVDAATVVPDPRPTEFVKVERVGGTVDIVTDEPMVTFFVWGESWASAHDLAQLVRQRIMSVFQLDQGVVVYSVTEVGGLSRAPDGPDGSPCYQFTIQSKLRGFKAP